MNNQNFLGFLAKVLSFIAGKKTPVVEIPYTGKPSQPIGYTSKDGVIHLALKHRLFDGLDDDERRIYIYGTGVHEALHQVFSNFDKLEEKIASLPLGERPIYGEMANLLEDPSIEYFASGVTKGRPLAALRSMIAYVYDKSDRIDNCPNALSQFFTALIQYGDMGLVKGHFTFPEARETFVKVISIFAQGVEEPNNELRFDYVDKVFELSRPLWQSEADAAETIAEIMASFGKSPTGGSGEGRSGKATGETASSERRKMTAKKFASESEAGKAESESEEDEEDGAGGANPEDESEGKEEAGAEAEDKAEAKAEETSEAEASGNSDSDINSEEEIKNALESEMSGKEDAKRLLDDDFAKYNKEESKKMTTEEFDPSYLTSLDRLPKVANRIADNPAPADVREYSAIVAELHTQIATCSRQIEKIFERDQDSRVYGTSGQIAVKRVMSGAKTANLFAKRREPDGKRDVAVFVAVDMSGSMCGRKIEAARKCCIGLAEIFGGLKIPTYIMGFTADDMRHDNADSEHIHFTQWKNAAEDRARLMGIDAIENNTDGVAIRYAARTLSKRPESHKILVVISDGMPSANYYVGASTGNSDTKAAVAEAKTACSVLGVAVEMDDYSRKIFGDFYGNDCIKISQAQELFPKLSNKIKKIINGR